MQLSNRLVPLSAAFFAGIAIMAMLGMLASSTFGLAPHPMDLAGAILGGLAAMILGVVGLKMQA